MGLGFFLIAFFLSRKKQQVTTEGKEQNKIAYMLNATGNNIKLQIRQLDGPTCGQSTLLLQGTKLQQALMQD